MTFCLSENWKSCRHLAYPWLFISQILKMLQFKMDAISHHTQQCCSVCIIFCIFFTIRVVFTVNALVQWLAHCALSLYSNMSYKHLFLNYKSHEFLFPRITPVYLPVIIFPLGILFSKKKTFPFIWPSSITKTCRNPSGIVQSLFQGALQNTNIVNILF